MGGESWVDLPDECWEFIFRRLGPISLACKRFLTITGHVRTSHTPPPRPSSSPSRFPVLTSLALCCLHLPTSTASSATLPSPPFHSTLRLSFQDGFPRTATRILGLRMQKTLKSAPSSCTCSLFSPTASPNSIG